MDVNNRDEEMLQDFCTPDKDSCRPEILENLFTQKYYLSHEDCLEQTMFGTHISINLSKEISFVTTNTTKRTVIIFDVNSFSEKLHFTCHNDVVTGLKFSPSNPNLLYTSSLDATIKVWDIRCNQSKAKFVVDMAERKMPITAFDINKEETIICGGTEYLQYEAFVLFWDIRQTNLLGGYWNCHSDDISCVKFNNVNSNTLATSGCDNVLNVFDISQPTEDEALIYTMNTEDGIDTFHWTSKNETDKIVVFTGSRSIQLWDIKDSSPIHKYDRQNVTQIMKRNISSECYCVPLSEGSSSDPLILTGSGLQHTKNTCLRTLKFDMQSNILKPHGMLISDTSQITQCAEYLEDVNSFVTIGESGSIRTWKVRI